MISALKELKLTTTYMEGLIKIFFNRLSTAVYSCNRSFGGLHLFGALQFVTGFLFTCDSGLSPLRYHIVISSNTEEETEEAVLSKAIGLRSQ